MVGQRQLDAIRAHLLSNKDIYGAVSAIVTTITAVIFGVSAVITATTANSLIEKQTKLIEAE